MRTTQRELIERWRDDARGTYRTWFLWDERLKNFRSIRRGIAAVVAQIEAGTFGSAYRGSSLETVVASIAEQRQLFKGADHAFLWSPSCAFQTSTSIARISSPSGASSTRAPAARCEEQVLAAIRRLDACRIKGSSRPPRTCSTSCTRRSRRPSTPPS